MIDEADLIEVRDDVVKSGLTVLMRQLVLGLAGWLFPYFVADGAVVQAVAVGIVFLGTLAYGQVKNWRDKRKAVALADSAPIGRVVK
jgi:hypothetical protein